MSDDTRSAPAAPLPGTLAVFAPGAVPALIWVPLGLIEALSLALGWAAWKPGEAMRLEDKR